jgi:AcrR family transcriptional regulator
MTETAPTADPRWRRLPEERPGQILDAALRVFSEKGLEAAKLEEIAARAGVSKGTIYLYFHSKEDLFREVVRANIVPLVDQVERSVGSAPAAVELERYLRTQWESIARDNSAGWMRLVVGELHRFPDLAEFYSREVISRSWNILSGIILRGIVSGEFRAIDPAAAVSMVHAITIMHAIWVGPTSLHPHVRAKPREQVIDEIIDFILHALRAAKSAAPAGAPLA